MTWIATTQQLPPPLQTVWLANRKGGIALGCRVETDDGWHWAESNGIIYAENGQIVSECESDDLEVDYWHELPLLPPYRTIHDQMEGAKVEVHERICSHCGRSFEQPETPGSVFCCKACENGY